MPTKTVINYMVTKRYANDESCIFRGEHVMDKVDVPFSVPEVKVCHTKVFREIGSFDEGESGRLGQPFVMTDSKYYVKESS